MSPIDPSTLDSDTPRTTDGRTYPDHLRAYESFDRSLLPLVADLQPATIDEISVAIEDPKARAALPRWLSSAEWRGLVERRDPTTHGPRSYVLGPRGQRGLAAA